MDLRVEYAARQSGDDLGAGAIHPRPPTAKAITRLSKSQHTASHVRNGGQ